MNGGSAGVANPSGGSGAQSGNSPAGSGSGGKAGGTGTGGTDASNGGTAGTAGRSEAGEAGKGGQAGMAGGGSTPLGPLPDLPNELDNPPVPGKIKWSAEASWETAAGFEPAFEINTPTATYFLVKRLGTIVSMVDTFSSGGHEWIGYSASFRPKRGLPNLGDCCQSDAKTDLTTTLDDKSVNNGHVRLNSKSASDDWSLVWDFYLTHFTLTVNRSPRTFSFGYRGVPGGALGTEDRLVLGSGATFAAPVAMLTEAFTGDPQWAYLADDDVKRSLFLIQYGEDSLKDRYSVAENTAETADLLFGNALLAAPLRFSVGLVESSTHAEVQARVEYVVGVTH